MQDASHEAQMREIMGQFAHKTGLTASAQTPARYLWTDAFAVCNFLQLYRHTGENTYRQQALDLVEQVHHVLGRHRNDDPRTGWISGLDDETGRLHPTLGGLRIGKRLDERKRNQPFDAQLEWERDGQYYHYLTKWMHALHQVSALSGDPIFNQWACELGKAMHRAFVHPTELGVEKQLYWKMSIDLTYPLVPSMGHQDPLDGLLTFLEVQGAAPGRPGTASPCDLNNEIADLSEMCRNNTWTTNDPLGIGGLLFDAWRMLHMMVRDAGFKNHVLLYEVLKSSMVGLQSFVAGDGLRGGSDERLAFRELGLAIGLHAVPRMRALLQNGLEFPLREAVEDKLSRLATAVPLAASIEAFWLSPRNRRAASWQAHEHINMVMLATSLAPDGFLGL